jgi:hypothetical protein
MAWPSARVRDVVECSSKRRAFVEFCSPPLREEMSESPRAICTPLARRARVSARRGSRSLVAPAINDYDNYPAYAGRRPRLRPWSELLAGALGLPFRPSTGIRPDWHSTYPPVSQSQVSLGQRGHTAATGRRQSSSLPLTTVKVVP